MQDNLPVQTVGELSFSLKRTLESAFSYVRVRGEISGFKRAASGHIYLALKDTDAVLDAVCWRGTALRLPFRPEDGLEVVCTGKITTFPGRSKYQLVIEQMEPAGAGALMALLEERKRRLQAEGLFDAARKRQIPYLPEVIGVVTSPTGAVIRDILHRLGERFPRRVLVWPVLVQGERAAEQIASAIAGFDGMAAAGAVPRPGVLIVARGGGSLEDLWAFNEEIVVRAASACSIPLISAVGHETDTTLIDFVADVRAPTPTAAAELAVPVRQELLATVRRLADSLDHAASRLVVSRRRDLDGLARGLPDPRLLLGLPSQRLDDLGERLRLRTPLELLRQRREFLDARHARMGELVADRLRTARSDLDRHATRLRPEGLAARIVAGEKLLAERSRALAAVAGRTVGEAGTRLDNAGKLLESFSYTQVLARGFALVRRPDGKVVGHATDAAAEPELRVTFTDGDILVTPATSQPRRAPKPKPTPEGQGSLL